MRETPTCSSKAQNFESSDYTILFFPCRCNYFKGIMERLKDLQVPALATVTWKSLGCFVLFCVTVGGVCVWVWVCVCVCLANLIFQSDIYKMSLYEQMLMLTSDVLNLPIHYFGAAILF